MAANRKVSGLNWKEIQQKTFTNWFNDRLRGNLKVAKATVQNLETDLADGLLLITLLENLAKPRKVGRYNKNPTSKIMCIENLGLALKFIKSENIKLVNIGPEDIYNCNLKLILGLVWTLIGHFQIRSSGKGLSTKQAMKEWLHTLIPDYNVTNFNTDWNDGRAVCALVDRLAPGSCPNHFSLNPANGLDNCRRGMELAEEKLEVPMVLDPEDLNNPDVDDLSVMTYVSYFFEPARNSLLQWVQAKIPSCNVTNLSTDWNTGVNLGALMEACHMGLVGNWKDMDPHKAFDNLNTCMKLAKERLDIVCPVGPGAFSDPAVDEIIVATYLSRFKYSQLTANPDELSIAEPDFLDNNVGVVKEPIVIPLDLGPSPDLALDNLSCTATGPSAEAVVTIEGMKDATAKFIPLEPGLYQFSCRMSGQEVEGSPISIPVIDPSTWSLSEEPPQNILNGEPVELYVKGESYGSSPLVEVEVSDEQGFPATHLEGNLWEMEPGTLQLTLTPIDTGRAKVAVSVTKVNVKKSPFEVSVYDPSNCKVSGIDDSNKVMSLDDPPLSFNIDTEGCGDTGPPVIAVSDPNGGQCTPSIEQQDDEPHKYTVSVAPKEAGPHTIKVSLQGCQVPGSPFEFTVLDTESSLDPNLCSARGPGLVKAVAGRPARFGIITPEEGLLDIKNALTVEIVSADGKTKVQPTIEDLHNKTYGVTYTVPIEGEYLITIKVYGEPIPGCDFKVNALPKPDPAKCRVYGPALHPNALLLSGRPLELYIDVNNAGHGELQSLVQGPKGTSPKIFVAEDNNICSLRVDTDRPGWYRINLWWAQIHIPDSPIDLKVHQAPNADNVRVYGPGISKEIQAHRPAEFFIETQDAGIGTLKVVLHGVKDAFEVDVKPENPINPRLLKGVYVPREGGDYEVTVMWSDVDVPGSPFKVKVTDWEFEMAERERELQERELEREREKERERKEKKRRKQKEKLRQQRLMYMEAGGYPGIMAPAAPGIISPTYMTPNGGLIAAGNNPTIMGMMGGAGGGDTVTTKRTTVQQEARRSHQQHKLVRRSTEAGFSETSASSQSESRRNAKMASLSRSRTAPTFSTNAIQKASASMNESDSSLISKPSRKPPSKLSRSRTSPGLSEESLQKTSLSGKKSSSYRGTAQEQKKVRPPMVRQRSLTSIEDVMAKNAGKLGDSTPIGGKMTANWAKLYNVAEEDQAEREKTPSPSPPRLRKLERRVSFSSDLEVSGKGGGGREKYGFRNEDDIPMEEPVKYKPVYVATGEIPLDVYGSDDDEDEGKKKKKWGGLKKGKKKNK